MIISWLLYIASITAGLFSLAKMVTQIAPEYSVEKPSIYGGILAKAVLLQIIFFVSAIIFTIFFALSMF